MARTAEGRAATWGHRQAQLALRATTLRDFQKLWPIWTGDEKSFRTLVSATKPLVAVRRGQSGEIAGRYFKSFRTVEGVAGAASAAAAPTVPASVVETSLYVTGMNTVKNGLDAGFSLGAARQNALVQVSGAIGRHVLNGGRGALIYSTASDKQAGGWARVTFGNCAFCAMLASRGAVYSEDTADFEAHDHCACGVEPQYSDSELPGNAGEYGRLWRNSVTTERVWDRKRGRYALRNSPDALNQFRRALAARDK